MLARFGFSRSQFLIVLLLAIVLVVMAVLQSQPQTITPYDPEDTSSTGLRALVLWLEELDYPVTTGLLHDSLPDAPGLLWIYTSATRGAGYSDESDADAEATYNWVERGGTLVLIGPATSLMSLSDRFGVEQSEPLTGVFASIHQVQPLLPDLPAKWDAFLAPHSLYFYEERTIMPILAQSSGDPVVALQFIGDGVVWHLTEDFALTNLNLRDDRIASLLPAILRTVPAGAPVVFSTDHLAQFDPITGDPGEVSTLQDWLYSTPFGQGTLLIMVALFVYILLQGRRLGPALPGVTASRPREAAEYVTALAGLQRRMRKPSVVAEHHRQRLKSAVGRLAQLPSDLADSEWLAQMHRADVLSPTLMNEVTELLAGYSNMNATSNLNGKINGKMSDKKNDEAELIRLVQATDALLASLPRANMQLVR